MNVRVPDDLLARLRAIALRLTSDGPGTVTVSDLLREGAQLAADRYAKPAPKKVRRTA